MSFQLSTPVIESTRSTKSFQLQNTEIFGESDPEYDTERSTVSAPSYSMITSDDSDAVLPDDQSIVTATEQDAEVIEETTLSEEETCTTVVRDK